MELGLMHGHPRQQVDNDHVSERTIFLYPRDDQQPDTNDLIGYVTFVGSDAMGRELTKGMPLGPRVLDNFCIRVWVEGYGTAEADLHVVVWHRDDFGVVNTISAPTMCWQHGAWANFPGQIIGAAVQALEESLQQVIGGYAAYGVPINYHLVIGTRQDAEANTECVESRHYAMLVRS